MSNSPAASDGSWEFVEDGARESKVQEFFPSKKEPPFELLQEESLEKAGPWDPRQRISRAFAFGQLDCRSVLEGRFQPKRDSFPLQSNIYVVLFDSETGDWPRYTWSLARFYQTVKKVGKGKSARREDPWREGVWSRGFASQAEAKAYLAGAQCRWPSAPF